MYSCAVGSGRDGLSMLFSSVTVSVMLPNSCLQLRIHKAIRRCSRLNRRGNEKAKIYLEQNYDGMKEGSREIVGEKDKTEKQESTRTVKDIFHYVILTCHKTDQTNTICNATLSTVF